MSGAVEPRRVVVSICTYRRNEPLRRLLGALAAQADSIETMTVGVSIIDDSPEAGARSVVSQFEGRFSGGIGYTSTASGNISTARNAAIATALDMDADWVMFIDDDCLPHERWIEIMASTQQRTGADLVTGPVEDIAPPNAPAWLTQQPFLNLIAQYADGEEPPYGTTANVFISAAWLRAHPDVRFRSQLGELGGEDMVWFDTARSAGIVHRYSLHAPVYEQVPLERCRFGYQLRNKLWFGNTMYVTSSHRGEAPNRLLLRGIKYLVNGLAMPLRRIVRREDPHLRYSLATICIGIGLVGGRFGLRLKHH